MVRTMVRNTNWFNEYILYSHDLGIEKQSFDLENQLGNVFFKEGKMKEAKIHYQKSITLWQCSEALGNLGYLNQAKGNLKTAEEYYIKAVKCNGKYKSYGNLVILLYKINKLDLAEHYTREAIQNYPNGAGFYFVLGLIEYKKGDKQSALKNLDIGYQLSHDPQIMDAYIQIKNNKQVEL